MSGFDFSQMGTQLLGNFLGGLTKSAGDSLTKAIFGRQDRISNRDYQFYQDLADSGNPREAARQAEFTRAQIAPQQETILGLAKPQADAYNTIQDETYLRDVQRETEGIQQQGDELGMSPWELTGSPPAAPLPSPGNSMQNTQKGPDTSALIGLESAKIQAQTQLATTMMNNQTAEKIAGNTNETAKAVANIQTADGAVPVSQAQVNAAQVIKSTQDTATSRAQEDLTYTQAAVAENQNLLTSIKALAELVGKTSIDIGGYKSEWNNNYKELGALYASLSRDGGGGNPTAFARYIRQLPATKWKDLRSEVNELADVILDAAGDMGTAAFEGISNFFSGKQ